MKKAIGWVCILAVVATTGTAIADWPGWRGPNGDGVVSSAGVPTEWSASSNVAWRAPLPEPGNSTPAVWGDKVFVSQPLEASNERALMCFSRTDGSLLWTRKVTWDGPEPRHDQNTYCASSPVTDGQRVIVWFGSAGLLCYDMDGNELWRKDLGTQTHMWGHGTSPVLHDNLCILNFGPGDREFLVAFNKQTGDEAWRVETMSHRDELALSGHEANGNANEGQVNAGRVAALRGSWATPVVVEAAGREQLIVTHPRRVTSYNPANGQIIWTAGNFAPLSYVAPMLTENNQTVIALGGYDGASLAVRTDGQGNVTESHNVWNKQRDGNWLGSGVVHDGYYYAANMDGIVHCFDAATGREMWKARTGGTTWGSMTKTDNGLIYLLFQSGETFVFRANPQQLEVVAQNDVAEATNATIAISNGQVFIRTFEALWCIGTPRTTN